MKKRTTGGYIVHIFTEGHVGLAQHPEVLDLEKDLALNGKANCFFTLKDARECAVSAIKEQGAYWIGKLVPWQGDGMWFEIVEGKVIMPERVNFNTIAQEVQS